MSEYITVQVEGDEAADRITLITNLNLAPDGPEAYESREAGDEGSPLAQTLFAIDGIVGLIMANNSMVVRRDPDSDVEWETLIDDITSALKDFFL